MQVVSDNGLALWRVMLQRSQPVTAIPAVERFGLAQAERLGARSFDDPPSQRAVVARRASGQVAIPPDLANFVGRTLDISV